MKTNKLHIQQQLVSTSFGEGGAPIFGRISCAYGKHIVIVENWIELNKIISAIENIHGGGPALQPL